MSLPVLVINRDCDRDRWVATQTAARRHGVEPIRIPALDAHAPDFPYRTYADLIGPVFWGRETIKPGALGCFLSHRKAWQHVVRSGAPALILEDDADLTEPPDRAGTALAGCDLVFANDRMADWVGGAGVPGETVLLDHLIAVLSKLGGPAAVAARRAPGGDAYAVTADGAQRLLAITAQSRIVCGVDWAMIWAALARSASVDGITELETLAEMGHRPHLPVLARVLSRPVARLRREPSVLRHSVEVPISTLLGNGRA